MYSLEQVTAASQDYFNGNVLAADVFISKYALKDNDGNFQELTPDDMHRRLAKEFARIEAKYPNPLSQEDIFNLFKHFKYIIPQGSPMSVIGDPYRIQSTSNCIVIGSPYDSYGGICKTDQELAQLMKRRCGVGFDISTIRPKGMITNNAAKTTDGIALFAERFSNTCREVAQDGRRGAEMQTCSVHHPEILTFINLKRDLKKVTGANLTVALTDEFLRAVEAGTTYEQRWPVSGEAKISNQVDARMVWDEIIKAARDCAEPGLAFIDTIRATTPSDLYALYATVGCNPCAEIWMGADDSCRLLVLNLFSYVVNPYTDQAYFDYFKLKEHVMIAQRLMDDLVDIEIECIDKIIAKIDSDPEPEDIKQVERNLWQRIRATAVNIRRTGLGVTAYGDVIAAMGFVYGSQESVNLVSNIQEVIAVSAHHSSLILAQERGAFPAFDYEVEKDSSYLNKVIPDFLRHMWSTTGRRNIALTTIAPTGSVSIEAMLSPRFNNVPEDFFPPLFGTTSGIEPALFLEATRRRKVPNDQPADFIDAIGDHWIHYSVDHPGHALAKMITGKEETIYQSSLANNIDWKQRVKLQAAAQNWVDHAISSTINLPEDVDCQTVSDIYMTAWKAGCKGITIYREGSRSGVIVSKSATQAADFKTTHAPKRPEILEADLHVINNKIILVGLFNKKPFEVFIVDNWTEDQLDGDFYIKKHPRKISNRYSLVSSTGNKSMTHLKDIISSSEPMAAGLTRLVSMSLRHGAEVAFVVEQLNKAKATDFGSLPSHLARVLKTYIPDKKVDKICPKCESASLEYQEGCLICTSCGWSKCG